MAINTLFKSKLISSFVPLQFYKDGKYADNMAKELRKRDPECTFQRKEERVDELPLDRKKDVKTDYQEDKRFSLMTETEGTISEATHCLPSVEPASPPPPYPYFD